MSEKIQMTGVDTWKWEDPKSLRKHLSEVYDIPASVLTPKQQLFVESYLLHFVPSRAAKEAGYNPGAGNGLLKNKTIQYHIKRKVKKFINKYKVDKEQILDELGKIIKFNMADVFGEDNQPLLISEMDEAITSCIKEFKIDARGSVTIKPYSKLEALKLLMSYFNMLQNREIQSVDASARAFRDSVQDLINSVPPLPPESEEEN